MSTDPGAGQFDQGNGEKILKRLIDLATRYKMSVPKAMIEDILFRRPGVRESIYRYMCYSSPNMGVLHIILDYLESDSPVDDASHVEFVNCLIDSTCHFDADVTPRIIALIETLLKRKSEAMRYCLFKILSKLGNIDQISAAIESTFDEWKTDYLLGRVVGSIWPITKGTPYEDKFRSLLMNSRNVGAREVVHYLERIGDDRESYNGVKSILRASNNSFPNKITHAKFILVHSVLHGKALDRTEKLALRRAHQLATVDPFYARVLKENSIEAAAAE